MMKILVTAASKHGSTLDIAQAIGEELEKSGHEVDVIDVEENPAVDRYDAAVIGSAIYVGNWMGAARDFVTANQAPLSGMPVWLFSSGPLGAENPQPTEAPQQIDELMAETGGRDHQIFVGSLDKDKLGLAEKLVAKAVKAPYGDFRDWDAIRAWAQQIDAALVAAPA
jgi:menaquinone-dependent protoporphyrinogen oxidase